MEDDVRHLADTISGETPATTAAPRRTRVRATPRTHAPLVGKRMARALLIARGILAGDTHATIAARLGCHEETVRRALRHPGYPAAVQRARAALRREAEEEGEAGRVEALRAARALVRRFEAGEPTISAGDCVAACRILEAASAPPSQTAMKRARAELVRKLPPDLRTRVVDALAAVDGDEDLDRDLAALSDEELRAELEGR